MQYLHALSRVKRVTPDAHAADLFTRDFVGQSQKSQLVRKFIRVLLLRLTCFSGTFSSLSIVVLAASALSNTTSNAY